MAGRLLSAALNWVSLYAYVYVGQVSNRDILDWFGIMQFSLLVIRKVHNKDESTIEGEGIAYIVLEE